MSTENSDIIYHYTSAEAAYFILSSQQIRMSSPEALNDSKELKVLSEALAEIVSRSKGEGHIRETDKRFFSYQIPPIVEADEKEHLYHIASFSKQGDSLSQWRSYSDDARGIAIGFDKHELWNYIKENNSNPLSNSIDIHECAYTLEEKSKVFKEISDSFLIDLFKWQNSLTTASPQTSHRTFESDILKVIPKMKTEAFKEEEEIRVVRKFSKNNLSTNLREEKDNQQSPSVEFKLSNGAITSFSNLKFDPSVVKRIILGPKCPIDKDSTDLKMFLESVGVEVNDDTIDKSAASYR
ncbi:DUF2971 domain-containing protein [Pseudoalteromonas sp. Of7M-16]|uniref:DUF2971 domain-containing protein n=1 Tax=Pseudoalteromonas sp. Of7M-16 TaxID=2917756 RepID=UPI001EF6FB6B|nr:DUF2971 domain-containing protein [Pseudoalteromonas sp. Of7M-16]MCG7546962.1 DUF2971 domain-containing protein [Pseudoalteromonas sp. Of7M-16]